jgi:hypothetical protein
LEPYLKTTGKNNIGALSENNRKNNIGALSENNWKNNIEL